MSEIKEYLIKKNNNKDSRISRNDKSQYRDLNMNNLQLINYQKYVTLLLIFHKCLVIHLGHSQLHGYRSVTWEQCTFVVSLYIHVYIYYIYIHVFTSMNKVNVTSD